MNGIELLTSTFLGALLGAAIVAAALLGHLIFRRDPVDNNCEHDWVELDKVLVQNPGCPPVMIIYVHRCNKCARVTKDKVSYRD